MFKSSKPSIIAEGEFKNGLKHGLFRFKNQKGPYDPEYVTYYEGKMTFSSSSKIN